MIRFSWITSLCLFRWLPRLVCYKARLACHYCYDSCGNSFLRSVLIAVIMWAVIIALCCASPLSHLFTIHDVTRDFHVTRTSLLVATSPPLASPCCLLIGRGAYLHRVTPAWGPVQFSRLAVPCTRQIVC